MQQQMTIAAEHVGHIRAILEEDRETLMGDVEYHDPEDGWIDVETFAELDDQIGTLDREGVLRMSSDRNCTVRNFLLDSLMWAFDRADHSDAHNPLPMFERMEALLACVKRLDAETVA